MDLILAFGSPPLLEFLVISWLYLYMIRSLSLLKSSTYIHYETNLLLSCLYFSIGIESFSKLGDSIYFEEQGQVPGIYIIQYIPSSLDWKSGQITLSQSIDPVGSKDNRLRVTITITSKQVSV